MSEEECFPGRGDCQDSCLPPSEAPSQPTPWRLSDSPERVMETLSLEKGCLCVKLICAETFIVRILLSLSETAAS